MGLPAVFYHDTSDRVTDRAANLDDRSRIGAPRRGGNRSPRGPFDAEGAAPLRGASLPTKRSTICEFASSHDRYGAMPLLFSYGTLQQDRVQLSLFGRLLAGQPDELPGFQQSFVPAEHPLLAAAGGTHHANATFTGSSDSRVSGTVFEISDSELETADRYEQLAAYERVAVVLASGQQAWAYVDARSRSGAV